VCVRGGGEKVQSLAVDFEIRENVVPEDFPNLQHVVNERLKQIWSASR
jgi:hypothetical protein